MRKEKLLDLFFKISVIVKGIDGFFEIIGGFILLFISSQNINQIYRYIYYPSFSLIILTILDAIIIVLTWREYKKLKLARV